MYDPRKTTHIFVVVVVVLCWFLSLARAHQQCNVSTRILTQTPFIIVFKRDWHLIKTILLACCSTLLSEPYFKLFSCAVEKNRYRSAMLVRWLVDQRPSNRLVYLRDGSAQTSFTCCHTEIEVADQTFYLTQSQYTDTGLTSPSTNPITPGAWQGRHWSANF